MKRFSSVIILALGLSLVGAGCSLMTTKQVLSNNVNAAACVAPAGSISYAGQDTKNALELLQAGHAVDVTAEGFVNAIDAKKPGDHEFWALYVNCKQAEVGAKDYISKTNDVIYWKLEAF